MSLQAPVFLIGRVAEIRESVGLPAGPSGNPRVVSVQMEPNSNRDVLRVHLTMERSLTVGLSTGDLVRLDIKAASDADLTAFEAAVTDDSHVGTHVFAVAT